MARLAGCEDFSEKLPDKWDTNIEENDCELSGGTVAEQGAPDTLLKQDGLYTRMVELQTESGNWAIGKT